jgi:hypothetical protein
METDQTSSKPRSSRPRKWTGRVLIGLAVIVVAIGAFELALRCIGLGKPVLIQRDQAAGYILEPNQNLTRFGKHIRTNSLGMRSDELPASKSAGVFRLLIVGDSYAYGTTRVDQSQIFAELLQRELPQQIHRDVEVLNASAGGWAISNEVGYVRSRGLFDADMVLLVLNQGDPTQEFEQYYPNDSLSYTLDHHPVFALQEFWDHYLSPKLFPETVAPSHIATPSEEQQTETQNLGYLDELLKMTRTAKTPLAVVYISIPTSPESPTRLIAWCADNHVPMIDLAPVTQHWPAAEVLNPDQAHFNTMGNRRIADQLEKTWPIVMPSTGNSAQFAN